MMRLRARDVALAAALLGAASVVLAQGRGGDRPADRMADRVRAFLLVVPGGAGAEEQTIVVRIASEGRQVASYQATITFDKALLAIVRATTPADGYRIVNVADTSDSRLRFAGFATSGFRHDTALTLRVRQRGPAATISMRLEVVGDPVGKPFAPSALQPATLTLPSRGRE